MAAYRIKVHAMKSTTASVGAVMISQLAKLLEQKAIAGDARTIGQIHPVFMEQLEELERALDDYYTDMRDEESPAGSNTTREETGDHLRELIQALDTYDYDGAERLLEALEAYDGGEEWKQLLEKLKEQEFGLQYDQCAQTAQQMLEIVSQP